MDALMDILIASARLYVYLVASHVMNKTVV